MSGLSSLDNLLFGFKITDINELYDLIDTVCIVGGFNKLISFDIKEDFTTIKMLDQACKEQRQQFKTVNFVEAKIDGRNRNGRRVSYVKEASVLAVKVKLVAEYEENSQENDLYVDFTFDVDIDEYKVDNIVKFVR